MNNYSKQREIILDVLKQNLIHPTAEDIYQLVIKRNPQISKSTVYRNINILVDLGKIQKISLSTGPDRYDYLYKKHYHAICDKCGEVYDFYYDFDMNQISDELHKEEIKMDVSKIEIHGICENCKSKINKEE